MKLQIEFTKDSLDWIGRFPDRALKAVEKGFKKALIDAEGQAKGPGYRQSGLHVRTGHLRRSIYSRYTGYLKGELGSPVKYAAIHQYGGIINHPGTGEIKPIKKKALRFMVNGQWVICRRVSGTSPHKISIPMRPYILRNKARSEFRYKRIIEQTFLAEMDKT